MNKKLSILIGVPGVGKSTYVNQNFKENEIWLSSDNIRKELFGDLVNSEEKNKKVFAELHSRLDSALKDPSITRIYYDATNINRKRRMNLYNSIKSNKATKNVEVEAVCFLRPLKTVLEQNNNRTGLAKVPNHVILNMYKSLQPPRIGVDCDGISKPYGNNFHEFTEEIDLDLPHDTPHHLESIREHINLTIKNAQQTGNPDLVEVAQFHDLGKFVCKEKFEMKNGEVGTRYVGHDNLSAMYYLANLNLSGKDVYDKLEIMEAINQHMNIHSAYKTDEKGFGKKHIEKYKLTPKTLEIINQFREIDSKSKYTKETHPDFVSTLNQSPMHFNYNKGIWEKCSATKRACKYNKVK